MNSPEVIHYGPMWFKRRAEHFNSFAACDAGPPNVMSTHKPWVTCEACKQSVYFAGLNVPDENCRYCGGSRGQNGQIQHHPTRCMFWQTSET